MFPWTCFAHQVLPKLSIILFWSFPIGMYEGQLGHKGMSPKNSQISFSMELKMILFMKTSQSFAQEYITLFWNQKEGTIKLFPLCAV